MQLGFIGLGSMGAPMAENIWKKRTPGDELFICNRSQKKAEKLIKDGVTWVNTNKEVALQADVIGIMVPDVPQIKDVLTGPDGIIAGVKEKGSDAPTIVYVSATISPPAIRQLAADAAAETAGALHVIDAPVSGGEVGAQAGTLSIMVGAGKSDYAAVEKVLQRAGTPLLLGEVGAGEVAKACNQLICASTMISIAEAAVVAERSGLDVGALLNLLRGGYAASAILDHKTPKFSEKDYSVSGAAWLWIKDLRAYLEQSRATGTPSVYGQAVLDTFQSVVDAGLGNYDSAVVQKWLFDQPAPTDPQG